MATKPIILTVDDDPEVLHAIERDIRRKYGHQFRVLHADSGAHALELLKQLSVRNEPVALLISDQRMPHITGVDFLGQASTLYPGAKRVLLTAYADTEVAIRAINTIRLDYYLTKPWDPPEENLYPILKDLLDGWMATFQPPFEGLRVIGHRWSSIGHQVKDFLSRNMLPYQWLDVEQNPQALQLLQEIQQEPSRLPILIFPDGSVLVQPSNADIAERVGLSTHASRPFYDLVIVGSGPAGLAAAVYGASEGLRTVLIEREAPGGQAGTSSRIENYLGFPVGLSGSDLARRAITQAKRFGVEALTPQEVVGLRVDGTYRIVQLVDGTEVSCHSILIATGVSYRLLDVPGSERLTGAGVFYGAAMTEAMSCKDSYVYIIGGANSAGQAAMHFSRYAYTVTMLVRADSLEKGMSQYLVDQIHATPNIQVLLQCIVTSIQGEENLESLTIKHLDTEEEETLPATAAFIFIGAMPRTDWTGDMLRRDAQGFLLTGHDLLIDGQWPKEWPLKRAPFLLESNIPGIFVAGDVRHGSVKRVASGVGEGSIAIQFIHHYLSEVHQ